MSTYMVTEPGHVVVRLRVEPDPRSRALTLEWWSADEVGGSHLITLEGDRAPIRQDYAIKQLAAGRYVVTAVLKRSDGSELRRQRRVFVIGEGQWFIAD